ncbi:MAG: EAL domain-containing protein [Lachnospiraceae bacterium]|jgi:diguanylate cyclase (GGDEF)-like protein/PAS domain S-box-containing protein|nr:EAL domain-containing protein [Lachnospiraceae bacterium]MEE3461242.1 EAL domain-containing protein [Lachnospiraceae bacterium]
MNKEDYYEKLVDCADVGMLIVSRSMDRIMYANDFLFTLMGKKKEDFVPGKWSIMDFFLPENRQKIRALVARQSSAGGDVVLEMPVKKDDGATIWVNVTAHEEFDTSGPVFLCTVLDVTNMKNLITDAYGTKKEIQLINDSIPGGVIKLKMDDLSLLYANDGFFKLAGYSRAEYNLNFNNVVANLIYEKDREVVSRLIKSAVDNKGMLGLEYRIVAKDGSIRWSYVNGKPIDDRNGSIVYLCVIMDITNRKKAESALKASMNRLTKIAEVMHETIWEYKYQDDLLVRSGALDQTYSQAEVIKGALTPESAFMKAVFPDDINKLKKAFSNFKNGADEFNLKLRMLSDNGYKIYKVSAYREKNDDDTVSVLGVTRLKDEDTAQISVGTRMKEADSESRLIKLADSAMFKHDEEKDSVTGLLPYVNFYDGADTLLAHRKENEKFAVICADINEFHRYNQHYGFSISNEILKRFSQILIEKLAYNDLCSRVDGDYFVIFSKYKDRSELISALTSAIDYQEENDMPEDYQHFEASIGVYEINDEDYDINRMLEKADLARRSIKGLKGNHYAIYSEDMKVEKFHEEEMIDDIRKAMREKTIDITYLPRIQGTPDNVIGCKVVPNIMLRDGSYIDNNGLLRLMGRTTRLEDFSFYVLNEVAGNLGAWKAQGNEVIPASIEFTASQISSNRAVKRINRIIELNNLEPSDFIFEFAERYFAAGTPDFESALKELGSYGYGIVISRFGSDHIAVNELRRLPVTGIKFHGEYLNDRMTSERDKKIFSKIIELVRDLGLKVYCGSVHTALQEKFVREIGVDIFEGTRFHNAVRNRVFEKYYLKAND